MTWRDWFYVISLLVLWGYLISGIIVRGESFSVKDFRNSFKKDWAYFLLSVFFPQAYVIFAILNIILDFNGFKEIVKSNYTK